MIGQITPQHKILEKLGEGSMEVVYETKKRLKKYVVFTLHGQSAQAFNH